MTLSKSFSWTCPKEDNAVFKKEVWCWLPPVEPSSHLRKKNSYNNSQLKQNTQLPTKFDWSNIRQNNRAQDNKPSVSSVLGSSLVVPVVDKFRDAVLAKNSTILSDFTTLHFNCCWIKKRCRWWRKRSAARYLILLKLSRCYCRRRRRSRSLFYWANYTKKNIKIMIIFFFSNYL